MTRIKVPLHPLALLFGTFLVGAPALASTEIKQEGDTWLLSNPALEVRVQPDAGRISVMDRRNSANYLQSDDEKGPSFKDVAPAPQGLSLKVDLWTKGGPLPVTVTLRLPDDSPRLFLAAQADNPSAPVDTLWFLNPFVLDSEEGVLAVADYSDGHIYPLDADPFPARWLSVSDSLDMPWVGMCDMKLGHGYAMIFETPDDAVVECKPYDMKGRKLVAPRIGWLGSKGAFGEPRRVIYEFTPSGGYVALAKAFRKYAQELGLIVTLADKAARNPNIRRLYGSVDVWGGSPAMAKEAHAAGVDRMLWHGKAPRDQMQQINDLGYLTSNYDNYTDIEPVSANGQIDSNHDLIPEHVVLKNDNQRMKAWLTYDKKTQFMKRCPTFWLPSAKIVIPKALEETPYLGRFIDVTTAEGLYECFDPEHPLNRTQKRACGVDLLAYVRSLGLVVGGEHGRWWAVPQLDYIEGMMSANHYFAWPAGHLVRPKSRQETYSGPYDRNSPDQWDRYDRYGIGHESRVPLWELVFHDCIVTTWYWGDSSDFLLQLDPSNQDRKDAFNVLYATIPMLWANKEGCWQVNRDRFLETFKRTTLVHRALAEQELLSHSFDSPDRALQRTRFADGTEVVVNFGSQQRDATIANRSYTLPQYGFAALGPNIDQSLSLVNGQATLTSSKTPSTSQK